MMRLRSHCLVVTMFAALAIVSGSRSAFCQDVNGSAQGTVINGNESKPVEGAHVHLINKTMSPSVDKEQITGPDGTYFFDDVAPGEDYHIDVYDSTGKLIGNDPKFPLKPGVQHATVPAIDISKGVTAAREAASGGLIQNDVSVSPGGNISNLQIRTLPLYNRNFLNLGLIQPGVHDVEQGSPLQGAAFSIAGQRSTSTDFRLDGVDNIASSTNQAIPFQVNEAVREFRVTYATPDLRYGQGSGGVVEILTSNGQAGDSKWHGTAFGYFNSDSLNANSPLSIYSNTGFARAAAYAGSLNAKSDVIFADSTIKTNPGTCAGGVGNIYCGYSPQSYNALYNIIGNNGVFNLDSGCTTQLCQAGAFNPAAILATQNSFVDPTNSKQFGGSAGGPLSVKKNIYLFVSYEGTLINNPTPTFERVPTYLDRQSAGITTSDATLAQSVLGLLPASNVGQSTTSTGAAPAANTNAGVLGFYKGTAPNFTHVHNVQLRPDIGLGDLGTLSFRYTGQLLNQLHDDTLPASSAYPGNGAYRKAQNQSAAVTYNFPFGQNRNLATIGFTQYRVDEVAQDRGFSLAALGGGALPTFVISGIDTQTTGAARNKPGLIGGWYDSFWSTLCGAGVGAASCDATPSLASRSRSPITPSLDGAFPLARIGAPLSAPGKHRDTEAFASDVLELRLGHNILEVGGDYRYQQNFSYEGGLARGIVVSNNIGEFTSDSESCISCSGTSGFARPSFDYELRQQTGYTGDLRSHNFGIFAQDKFHATDHITIQFGVRYDYFGQPLDTQNRLWNYSQTNQGLLQQGSTSTFDGFGYKCGGGTTFFDSVYSAQKFGLPVTSGGVTSWPCSNGTFGLPNNNNNVTGMAGFSYAPGSARHVFRGAVGGYYDHLPATYNQRLLQNRPSPFNANDPSSIYGQNFNSTYSSANCVQMTQCGLGNSSLNIKSAIGSPASLSTFQNYQAASGANILYERDPAALQTPYSIQYSGSYQYRFSNSWNGEVGYVGSLGHRLPLVYDGNFGPEFYCQQAASVCDNNTYFPVFTESHIGESNYNSIIARVEGRLWHGLTMHGSYTYSKSLDNIAGSSFPNSTDSLFTQLAGRQLYGAGNPAVAALAITPSGFGSNGGLRSFELFRQSYSSPAASTSILGPSLLQSANIPSFDAVQSALTTTGSRSINTSHYSLPQNPLAFSSAGATQGVDYGASDFDVRQRGVADFVWNVPFFHSRLLDGFTVSGITTVQTGQPFTIFSGPAYGQVTQLASFSSNSAVNTTGKPNDFIHGVSGANLASYNNAACPNIYAQPTLYRSSSSQRACTGTVSRNAFFGPSYISQDVALQKATRFHKEQQLVLRAEGYNIFNRANFYNPISQLSSDGVHINPEFGIVRSAHDPFRLQLAVRLDF